jgi:homoserine dehydrogenase
MSMELANVNIGLLGCGTVGASLCKLIDEQSEAIAERTGLTLNVVMVAVRDVSQPRSPMLTLANSILIQYLAKDRSQVLF